MPERKKADEIATAMDVHRATIYHELQRGGAGVAIGSSTAQIWHRGQFN